MACHAGARKLRALHGELMQDVILAVVLVGTATAALSRLLTAERGPWNVLGRFRKTMRSKGEIGAALSCAICGGFWIAFGLSVFAGLCILINATWALVLLLPFSALGISYALLGMGGLWQQPSDEDDTTAHP